MGLPTDGKALLETPIEIVEDNRIAMEGEAKAIEPKGRTNAPAGFELEMTEPEMIGPS